MKNRSQRRAERFQRGAEKITGAQVFGSFVPLAAAAAQTSDGWTVLAYEVSMKESGVVLSRKDFEDCVRNFASYPCSPVTIEHADTDFNPFAQPPTSWREPNGHVEDLRVGTMTRGSKQVATLEGKVSYLPPTDADVKARKWRFGSITIIQGAVDEESGATLGSMLWSWSLTAHPRLTGLPAIAASLRAAKHAGSTTLPEAFADLPAGAGAAACAECCDACEACLLACVAAAGAAGSDSSVRAACVRCVAALTECLEACATCMASGDPTACAEACAACAEACETCIAACAEACSGNWTAADKCVAACDACIAACAACCTACEAATPGAADDPMPSMSRGRPAGSTTEKPTMKFSMILAALGLAAAASEEEAEKRLTTFAQLGADALKALGLPLTASAADVATKVSTLSSDAAKVPALTAELTSFRAAAADRAKADRAAYLDDLIAAQPHLAPVRASLALHFESDPTGFATTYPRPSREDLTRAAAEGAQRSQDGARAQGVTVSAANPATKDAPKPAGDTAKPARADFAAVLEEFGYPSDALAVTDAIAKGHTPATLRAALAA